MFAKIVISLIRCYQFFSKRLPIKACRFYPTCSEYMVQAIEKYGLISGVFRGIKRLLRCHPGYPGGVDLP